MAGTWRGPSGTLPTWIPNWLPGCSARPGSQSPIRTAVQTARLCSGLLLSFLPTREAGPEAAWLDPVPDAMVTQDSADPAAIIAVREGLRLALIVSLQYLPPRQRAVSFLRNHILGSPGDWRMLATSANGQPAAAAYTRESRGVYQPYGIVVLTVTSAGIRRILSFGDPGLVGVFGFRSDLS